MRRPPVMLGYSGATRTSMRIATRVRDSRYEASIANTTASAWGNER